MYPVKRGETSKSKLLLAPIALSEATAQTQWIDRHDNPDFAEGEYAFFTGATTGSPTSFVITLTVQESVDKSTITTAQDYALDDLETTITAAGTMARLHFAPEALKRYYRLQYAVDFTGGSSPTVIGGAVLTLDGARKVPVASTALATE